MRKINKKLVAVGSAATLAVVGGGIAFAYWTTTGAGSGNATAKSANGTLVLHADFDSNVLAPGLSTPVKFTADNSSDTDLRVGTITSVVETGDPACLPTDFVVDPFVSDTTVLAGATGKALGTGSIALENSAVNQDACKGATITLQLTSN